MKKLAIVIPYYKITFFEECLKSLALQTNKNFNLYIGNDNSPKGPESIINKYKEDLNINYKKFEENIGNISLVQQWDRCIKLSDKEEWLMILGDDDTIESNFVEEFYKAKQEIDSSINVLRFASRFIDEKNNPISDTFINPDYELAKDFFLRCSRNEGRCSLTEHIFTRATYNNYGFRDFPVAFGSDNVAWMEFSEMGKVKAVNTSVANIRISAENLSAIKDRELGFKRVAGYYKYNRYVVENLGYYFNKNEKVFLLNKAYSYLRIYNRKLFDVLEYIFFMTRKIGVISAINIILNNRNKFK